MTNLLVSTITSFLAVLQVQFYISPKKKIYFVGQLAVVTLFTYLYLSFTGNSQRVIITLASFFIMVPIGIMTYQEKLYCKLYNLLIQALVSGLFLYLSEYIFGSYRPGPDSNRLSFSLSIIGLNVLWCIGMYLMRKHKYTLMPYDEEFYKRIFIFCLVVYPPFLLISWGMDEVIFKLMSKNMSLIVAMTLLVMIIVIMNEFIVAKNGMLKEHKMNIISTQSKLFIRHIDGFQDYQKELRMIQHDQKHCLRSLLNLLECGDSNRAITLLKEMQVKNAALEEKVFCEEPLINSILLDIQSRAQKQATKFDVTVRLDDLIMISDMDISSILYNAFDNALEYCENLPDHLPREIRASIYTARDYFVLTSENILYDKPVILNGKIETTKAINKRMHGIGLESINYIARKYKGVVRIEADDLFRLKVVMENRKNS